MTFPRLAALREQWRIRPPVHWIVAAALKYSPAPDPAPEAPATSGVSIEALKAAFPGGRLS